MSEKSEIIYLLPKDGHDSRKRLYLHLVKMIDTQINVRKQELKRLNKQRRRYLQLSEMHKFLYNPEKAEE